MADPRAEDPSLFSEERTEPFSQGEIDDRLRGIRVEETYGPSVTEAVPLDFLQVEDHHHEQGIRILVRPLTRLPNTRSVSPGNDNCKWLALRAEIASSEQPEHKVLAVTQTARDIKFSVRIPGDSQEAVSRPPLWCELYYDPASDKVIFYNRSDVEIQLSRVSSAPLGSPPGDSHTITPVMPKALKPGTWRIKANKVAVLDFRILEKPPVKLLKRVTHGAEKVAAAITESPQLNRSSKRSITADDNDEDDDKRVKRRVSDAEDTTKEDGVVVFLRPAHDPLVFPLPSGRESRVIPTSTGQALLDNEEGDTVAIPGVCELDEYQLTMRDKIASSALSSVYTAEHSNIPDNIVTVKVLKTRVSNPNDKPSVHERNVIRQADMWLRECQSQEDLQHDSIVRYYGGDARFLSLYMEHVEARDLTSYSRWRDSANELFKGSKEDGLRVLRDISSALEYIHSRKLVHNDIKPANILYSPERGAVLCDFGLSTLASSTPMGGGTPYYIPPEFIGRKQRGPASDVWALGVTMLYVLRKITFPDSRASKKHPKPLYWQIAGINNPTQQYRQYGNGQPAVNQMQEWLKEIFQAREKLDRRDKVEKIVSDMLNLNPNERVTMAGVLKELGVDQELVQK